MQLNKFKMLGAAAIIVAAGMNVAHAQAGYGTAVSNEPTQTQQVEQKSIFQSLKDALNKKVEPTEAEKAQLVNQETKELLNRKATTSFESAKYGTIHNIDDRMSNEDILMTASKQTNENINSKKTNKYGTVKNVDDRMSNEDILLSSTKNTKENKKADKQIKKGDILLKPTDNPKPPETEVAAVSEVKPGDILLKAWQGTKNVATKVAEKGKESLMAAKAQVDAENQKKQEEARIVRAEMPVPEGQITREDVIKAKDKVLDGMSGFLNKLRSEPKSENDNKVKPK